MSIASEREIHTVMDFLSRSQYPSADVTYEDDFECPSSSRRQGENPYLPRYPGYNPYRDSYRDWSREKSGQTDLSRQSNSDSSSGSSGIDDPFARGDQFMHDALRSRSPSNSSYHNDQEANEGGLEHGQGEGGKEPQEQKHSPLKSHVGSKGSINSDDSGIHVLPGKKMADRHHLSDFHGGESPEGRMDRDSRGSRNPRPFDFSQGFGPLISSEPPHRKGFGMGIHGLSNSPDYSLGLFNSMQDSDSDHSG